MYIGKPSGGEVLQIQATKSPRPTSSFFTQDQTNRPARTGRPDHDSGTHLSAAAGTPVPWSESAGSAARVPPGRAEDVRLILMGTLQNVFCFTEFRRSKDRAR